MLVLTSLLFLLLIVMINKIHYYGQFMFYRSFCLWAVFRYSFLKSSMVLLS